MTRPIETPNQISVVQGPRAQAREHDWVNERSRALGHAVGQKILANPVLVQAAINRLNVQMREADESGDIRILPALQDWKRLLEAGPMGAIVAFLEEDSVRATRLRQSSPFAGVLSLEERDVIFRHFEEL